MSNYSHIKSELISVSWVVLLALSIRILVFELFCVPTPSMNATILEGDYIFATKYSYGYSRYSIPFSPKLFSGRVLGKQPQRGDIIIMRPPHMMEERYIKRLIALPGDKVEIKDDVTYINDIPLKREQVGEYTNKSGKILLKFKETFPDGMSFFSYKMKNPKYDSLIDRSNYGPYTIEEGNYFFLGDNRDNSGDSRYQLGMVPFENLIAKAQFIIFFTGEWFWDNDINLIQQVQKFIPWVKSIRFHRIFDSLYYADPTSKE